MQWYQQRNQCSHGSVAVSAAEVGEEEEEERKSMKSALQINHLN